MGGEQAANVLATVKQDQLASKGQKLMTEAELAEFKRPTLEKYEKEELLNRVLSVINEANSMSSWAYFLGESGVLDDLSEVDCEYWDWIYGVGKSIPERAELHLAGLILANEYLEKENQNNE
jgi:hypothetical protein